MVKYILKKIVYMIVTLWIILTATFFLMYTMPGDPTQASSKVLPEAVQENLKAKWGLAGHRTVCHLSEESVPGKHGRILYNPWTYSKYSNR